MISVCAFRLDDITPDMDWDRFYRVKAIFDKYKVKPLIGIVPDNGDDGLKIGEYHEDIREYAASLQNDGWLIAPHGIRHIYETRNAGLLGLKQASEFAGLPYEAQYDKIERGREILQKHGLNATIFMAPGHTYDKNTLKALKALDFTCVSDGYTNIPYFAKGLLFIPCRSSKPALALGVDTVCIHCNELQEGDYRELENFLEHNLSHVVSFGEVMDQLWYPKKLPLIWLQEKKNLFRRRIRNLSGGSPALQAYLQATYDEDGARKRKNRIKGLPGLLLGRYTKNR